MKQKRVLLTKRECDAALKKYEGWVCTPKGTKLHKTFTFDTYVRGLVFIARISVHAEVLNHHPDIEFSYNKVKVKLSTHELGGVTALDIALLERIEKLAV